MGAGDPTTRFTAPFGDGIFSAHGRLAQRESAAFTRQRSLVRNQHRPPLKRVGLQAKPRFIGYVATPGSTLLTTVEIPMGERVVYHTRFQRNELRVSGRAARPGQPS